MEKKQYEVCHKALARMHSKGILEHLVLVGSWCVLAYEDYFKRQGYRASIRTRDIEFLVSVPARFAEKVDLSDLLRDLDFVRDYRGTKGYIVLQHPDLIIEFLVPDRGAGMDEPYPVPDLGVNAQPLRLLHVLRRNLIRLNLNGVPVTVPHPSDFGLHKLLIAGRRSYREKAEKDRAQAVSVLKALVAAGEEDMIRQAFSALHRNWQKTVKDELSALGERALLGIVAS